jgi:hypothetical protein
MKTCTKCGVEKPLDEFYKNSHSKNGIYPSCKVCCKEHKAANKNRLKEYNKKYNKKYYTVNKDKIKQHVKEYSKTIKDKIHEYNKEYRTTNKNKIAAHRKEFYVINKDRINERNKKYRQANKGKLNEYKRNRIQSDSLFALISRLRGRTRKFFKGKKSKSSEEILGAPYEVVMKHIESLFTEGMTWENRSKWHIDHYIPLASAETEEEMYRLCHYTNLQPLWAEENLRKGAKICPINFPPPQLQKIS